MWVISFMMAYLMCGFGYATRDLQMAPVDAPGWTHQPTAGKFLFVVVFWPFRQFANLSMRMRLPQKIALLIVQVGVQILFLTGIIRLCIYTNQSVFENVVLQALGSMTLFFLVSFLMPLLNLALMPVMLLVTLILSTIILKPLDWIFQNKN